LAQEPGAPPDPATADLSTLSPEEIAALYGGEVVETEEKVVVTPGSAQTLGEEELERHARDAIHHIRRGAPGASVRAEAGVGLRPSDGMRGVSSRRSAKTALREAGVPIAPAPDPAPAAYCFPRVARMSSIEVMKGRAAILHG